MCYVSTIFRPNIQNLHIFLISGGKKNCRMTRIFKNQKKDFSQIKRKSFQKSKDRFLKIKRKIFKNPKTNFLKQKEIFFKNEIPVGNTPGARVKKPVVSVVANLPGGNLVKVSKIGSDFFTTFQFLLDKGSLFLNVQTFG